MMVDYLLASGTSSAKMTCIYVTSMRLRVNNTLHMQYNVTSNKYNDSSQLHLETHVVMQTK